MVLAIHFQETEHTRFSSLARCEILCRLYLGSFSTTTCTQFFTCIPQTTFQILGPAYSEAWFDLKGRTTATMVIAICVSIIFPCLRNKHLVTTSESNWWRFRPNYFPRVQDNSTICRIFAIAILFLNLTVLQIFGLAIICTAAIPFVLLIGTAPPTPPSMFASFPCTKVF